MTDFISYAEIDAASETIRACIQQMPEIGIIWTHAWGNCQFHPEPGGHAYE